MSLSRYDLRSATALILMAAVLSACMTVMIRELNGRIHWAVIVFLRSCIGFVVVMITALLNGYKPVVSRNKLVYSRSIVGGLGILCTFYAAYYLPPASAIMLLKTAPIWVIIIGAAVIGQHITWKTFSAVGVSIVGVYFITQPQIDMDNHATVVGMMSGMFMGLVMFMISRMRKISNYEIVSHFLFVSMITSAVAVTWLNAWHDIAKVVWSKWTAMLVLGVSLSSAFSQLLTTKALQKGNAAVVSSLSYSAVVFAIIIEILALDIYPVPLELLGMTLITGSAIAIIFLRHQQPAPIVLLQQQISDASFLHEEQQHIFLQQKEQLNRLIEEAEQLNCCEMVMHFELNHRNNCIAFARQRFTELKVDKTPLGNGVFIYLNVADSEIILLADSRIQERLGKKDLKKLKRELREHICEMGHLNLRSLMMGAAESLGHFYPPDQRTADALPNEISVL